MGVRFIQHAEQGTPFVAAADGLRQLKLRQVASSSVANSAVL